MKRDELLDLIPAYALGALDPEERAQVKALLGADAEAKALLAEHQQLADSLVLLAPARQAPGHLAGDLQRRIAAERANVTKRRRAWLLPLAASLALLIGSLIVLTVSRDDAQSGEQLFTEIAAAPGALRVELTAAEDQDVAGVMVASADGLQAVVQVWRLPTVEEDQRFQLWLVDDEGPRDGGLFEAESPDGPTYVVLPLDQPVQTYRVFGVTIEPRDGSPLGNRASGPNVFRVLLQA